MNLGFVILFPLTFTSNVFVEPATMPDWLRTAATVNPVTHLTTAVRALMGGVPAGHEIVCVLLASAVIIGLFAPVTAWLYHRRGAPGGGTERAPTTTSRTPIPGTSADS